MKVIVNGCTISETLNLKKEYKELMRLDRLIGHLKKNKEKYMLLVIMIALIFPATTLQVYAQGIGELGKTAYDMGKAVAKVICLIGWLTDSIKCVLTGTVEGLGRTSVKWITFALIVSFLPDVVDWIFSV